MTGARRGKPIPALALLLAAACCGAPEPPPAAAGPGEEGTAATAPRRIVALAPSVVETLFALGLGERVVGVGDYARWPEEVAELPRLGGLYDARLESLVALDPDLAVLMPSEADLAEELRRLGVPVLTVPFRTLAEIEASIVAIARRCGVEEAGRRLLAEWRAGLAPRPVAAGVSALLVVGRQPGRLAELVAAGDDTFLGELLARLGAVNAVADTGLPYPQLGLEAVLSRAPAAIVELAAEPLPEEVAAGLVADWRGFPDLPAVAGGCLEVIDGHHVLVPGPRLPRLYDQLAAALGGCAAAGEAA